MVPAAVPEWANGHVGGDHRSQGQLTTIDLENDAQVVPAQHGQLVSRMHAVGENLREDHFGLVLDVNDAGGHALAQLGERRDAGILLGDLTVGRRDRIAVRVDARVAELFGQRVGPLRCDPVLVSIGAGVPLARVHTGLVGQVALPEPVSADHLEGVPFALIGQQDATVGQPQQAACCMRWTSATTVAGVVSSAPPRLATDAVRPEDSW